MMRRLKANSGYFRIYDTETKKIEYEHRYVWKQHYGSIPDGYHVHHKDGNRGNNNIDNLECIEGRQHNRQSMKGRIVYKSEIEKSLFTRRIHGVFSTAKVICVETLIEYSSIAEASRAMRGNKQNISNALNNRQNTAYGFHWKYGDNYSSYDKLASIERRKKRQHEYYLSHK